MRGPRHSPLKKTTVLLGRSLPSTHDDRRSLIQVPTMARRFLGRCVSCRGGRFLSVVLQLTWCVSTLGTKCDRGPKGGAYRCPVVPESTVLDLRF